MNSCWHSAEGNHCDGSLGFYRRLNSDRISRHYPAEWLWNDSQDAEHAEEVNDPAASDPENFESRLECTVESEVEEGSEGSLACNFAGSPLDFEDRWA